MPPPVRYWDACCFLGWLAKEEDKVEDCRPVIRAAEAGDVRLVTSSLTLTEVIHLKGRPRMSQDMEATITSFFKKSYILVRLVDRRLAEYARQLIWEFNFKPKDAIHVATAVLGRIPRMDTFDKELIDRSGLVGDPALIIGRPDLPQQMEFFPEPDDNGELT